MITKEFKKYKVPISNETMDDYCFPKKFSLQAQQKFLPELLSSKLSPWNTTSRGILVYHMIGSGKTCTAISIAEKFKKKMNINVVLPASLISNFESELRSQCADDIYISNQDRNKLSKLKPSDEEYNDIIEKSNKKISKTYSIYSYHKFIALIKDNEIKNLNKSLLIIDEVQNMISINGTFYNTLKNIIDKSKNLKIVLLSATPMFDKPIEIALTLNLIHKNLFDINTFNNDYIDNNLNAVNMDKFREKIKNMVSYYRGAPPIAYPKVKFSVVKCNMSKFQYKSYLTSLGDTEFADQKMRFMPFKDVDILNLSQNFLLGPRLISNVAYPNKSTGDAGFMSFRNDVLLLKNIGRYSIKFKKILKKIKEASGPVFVYSNFIEYGIKPFQEFLNYNGWKDYHLYGEGEKRYSIWSGDTKHDMKEEIRTVYNNINNIDGSMIKIMIGSPSIKEGVSLKAVSQVHIMEPSWNVSKLNQICGRGIRFCSHKDLKKSKRNVEVYLYLATYQGIKTIDQHIWSNAKKKAVIINEFELALKETAIDCELFYNRNNYASDNIQLKCSN